MSDQYLEFTHSPLGKPLAAVLGLPAPPRLRRASEGWSERPLEGRGLMLGAAPGSVLCEPLVRALADTGAQLRVRPELGGFDAIKSAAAAAGVRLAGAPGDGERGAPFDALVYDASGLSSPAELRALYDFFQPLAGRVPPNARMVVIGRLPEEADDAPAAAAAASLNGFTRSLAKEVGRKGATANLVQAAQGAGPALAGVLRFFLTDHSAFISGQPLVVRKPAGAVPGRWAGALSGRTAIVTGAARGIGAAIAGVLAREGALVIGVDRPQEEGALGGTLAPLNGIGLPLDITAPDAGARIAAESGARGGADLVVHNAGITRDKMLRNMPSHFWDQVIDVNLASIVRVNAVLLKDGLKAGARMVCVSSIGGIAGNAGQTNYGATKAGVIGYVRALAQELGKRGGAVNAVAPGFIETHMTAAMPVGPRVAGRLMCSLSQGGLPQDIAEAVAFLGGPYAGGVNGQTLRVCGQHLVGA